jgi:hypothetical protein
LLDRIPPETKAEAARMRIASEGSGVLQKACANARWLPDVERIRRRLRKVSTPHRLDPSQQQSLLKLLEQNEVTANNDNGCVLFVQTQVCHCHEVDLEEERLALERQLRNAKRAIERLSQAVHNAEKSLETDTCDAAASTLASSQRDLDEAVKREADLSKQLANLNAPQVGAAVGAACCRCYCAGAPLSRRAFLRSRSRRLHRSPRAPSSSRAGTATPHASHSLRCSWKSGSGICCSATTRGNRASCASTPLAVRLCSGRERRRRWGGRACAPAAAAAPSHPTQR